MNQKIVSTCLGVLLLLVRPVHAGPKPGELPANTAITLHRDACEKRCAVYDVTIRANGSVTYEGRHYVRKTGHAEARIDPSQVRALVNKFNDAGFFSLNAEYDSRGGQDCESVRSDGPRAVVSIRTGDEFKTVMHDHKCVGPVTATLSELEDSIDKAAGVARWIK
jgi:hypothetical protein